MRAGWVSAFGRRKGCGLGMHTRPARMHRPPIGLTDHPGQWHHFQELFTCVGTPLPAAVHMREHLSQQLLTCHVNTSLSSCSHGLFDFLNTCFDPFRIKIGVPDMKVTQKSVHNLCFEPNERLFGGHT